MLCDNCDKTILKVKCDSLLKKFGNNLNVSTLCFKVGCDNVYGKLPAKSIPLSKIRKNFKDE